MRAELLTIAVTAACAAPPVLPLRNTSDVVSSAEEPIVDESEWQLLHEVAIGRSGSLRALAGFYQHYGAWDAYAAVRMSMLETTAAAGSVLASGGAPGGPFPRIGLPRATASEAPRTVLGRWLDRAVLPELFAAREAALDELERGFREAVQTAPPGRDAPSRARLADLLCVRLRFPEAIEHYTAALAAARVPPDLPRLRARLDDARRIVRPSADRIATTTTRSSRGIGRAAATLAAPPNPPAVRKSRALP